MLQLQDKEIQNKDKEPKIHLGFDTSNVAFCGFKWTVWEGTVENSADAQQSDCPECLQKYESIGGSGVNADG